ncbi:MAG: aminoacetone oxidase family FAD-binding enzyme [Alphaproteobacteria bacterium]|nr:aminoacetone oxidase family FAD-binding enzyme [Alphaproteobacteria bacterium]
MKKYDVIIIGAGASGLFAATYAERNGNRVAIIDMGNTPARKVAVSGGGRCNFTNMAASVDRYFGKNQQFVRGALARFSPANMLVWMQEHNLGIIEKAPGQYFCTNGAKAVVNALIDDIHKTEFITNTMVNDVDKQNDTFIVHTTNGDFQSNKVIIATGGTSFANLGVSDIGHKIARKFGHKIVPIRPALCQIKTNIFPPELAGISMSVSIRVGRETINDDMIITHNGIGGPATYRATVRDIDNDIIVNLAPNTDMYEFLDAYKHKNGKKSLAGAVAEKIPERVAHWICGDKQSVRIADLRDLELRDIANKINSVVIPLSNIKFYSIDSAEVVRGGVDTADISSKTMESKLCSGLYFTGEVIDIAGDLGGFNLHWAWASGFTAGNVI